jgi:hypothetical protein
MPSLFDHLAALREPLDQTTLLQIKAAMFEAYGKAMLHRQAPARDGANHRKRKPSLAVLARQARKAGLEISASSVRTDGTIVLHYQHNLDDNHAPAISPDENEWDEVLRQ